MKHSLFFRACLVLALACQACAAFAQKTHIDTVIHMGTYDSYFSYELKNPVFVTYTLYKGGGDCDRSKFRFRATDFTATDKDYDKRYDKGHLANAEDFAFNCKQDEATFWYFNCTPQTPNLNRGPWKKDETMIRELSQQAKLLVLCGSYFTNDYIGNKVYIPKYCWKVVQNTATGQIVLCRYYTNTTQAEFKDVSVAELMKMTNVKLMSYLKKPVKE